MDYNFREIEQKWQARWAERQTFKTREDASKPKFYVLDMFPYPSGAGLHVGHPEGYTATDILCRYKRMKGFNVLHPMGWDAFGLPAEQYAVETGTHPAITTKKNVDRFREQIRALKKQLDPEIYGGAPLLGVPGAVIIGHGSSSHKAIYYAVKAGVAAATNDVSGLIEKAIAAHAEDQKQQ